MICVNQSVQWKIDPTMYIAVLARSPEEQSGTGASGEGKVCSRVETAGRKVELSGTEKLEVCCQATS